ncbi:hypothetical protein HB897_13555 [Listeria seeligeri]|uniref:Uncharacterized protein n=1 Tax=Listeria seeligeri TaxID=1640 RepID=A0A7X0X4A6_LISSE|nr:MULTISPECIES: hypothetical protein [Listeria]MBC1487255.1 hypothetical protein [Listeria seeligeri]MBK1997128.1 hypothetical protein [Listeria ivanovii subsp. londoniensis]UCK61673.1 hypothetical protein pLIS47_00216c [Listeria ivanovii]UCK61798.1 hypothetical protein pLIS50_00216c [Listeria seeligeri]UCK61938.1 hypothetical protein pLIS52_00196c [Listeria seeligeri]
MLEIIFLDGKEMDIQEGQKLDYNKAQALCERKNEELLSRSHEASCSYQLLSYEKVVYESRLHFPYDLFDFHEILQKELHGKEEAEAFLTWFEEQINYKAPKIKTSQKKERRPKKEKQEKRRKERKVPTLSKKMSGVLFLCLFGLGLVGFTIYMIQPEAKEKPAYSTLMKEKKYNQAAKVYPEKQAIIREKLFQQAMKGNEHEKNVYKEYNDTYPSKTGEFDRAVLASDFQATIKAYEKKPSIIEKDSERLAIVGYAYLKNKDLAAAKDVAEKTENLDLEKRIAHYEQLTLSIANREKKIKDLQKDPIKNEKAIQTEIDLLYQDKEALLKL